MSIELSELVDRAELADLVHRQGRWLDEQRWAEADTVFTADATVRTPGGTAAGLDALTAQAARNHADARTQHVTSNALIELAGDRAVVSANLVATFVTADSAPAPSRTLGERYRFEAVRTAAGWRFDRLEVTPIWRTEAPLAA